MALFGLFLSGFVGILTALRPGRCALIVGDVTGHDMHAASLMGQLRTATRTLASLDLTPSEVLARLDQLTADLTDEETSATCVYAVYDTSTGEWDMARAGHPLPAVVRPGHNATFLNLPPGMPLGVGGGQYEAIRVRVPGESTLVLYTDGSSKAAPPIWAPAWHVSPTPSPGSAPWRPAKRATACWPPSPPPRRRHRHPDGPDLTNRHHWSMKPLP